jgi:hypothetical protein
LRFQTATPATGNQITLYPSNTGFDLFIFYNSVTIRSSRSGYTVLLRVGSTTAALSWGDPVSLSGVTLSIDWMYLASKSALLRFFLYNNNSDTTYADVSTSCNIYFDAADAAQVYSSDSAGFVIYGNSHSLSFTHAPLFTRPDNFSYWFGNLGSLSSNYFGQTDSVAYTSGNSAMAFSWQSVPVPPHTSVCAAVLVVFDTDAAYPLSQRLTVYPFPDPVYPDDVISVFGDVSLHEAAVLALTFG